jgi:hypothetical protein
MWRVVAGFGMFLFSSPLQTGGEEKSSILSIALYRQTKNQEGKDEQAIQTF